jgi:DNA (cytosine-5)-methyltransferase 1
LDKINDQEIIKFLDTIAEKSFAQKGVFTVLITLLVHKIYNPLQDIRLHQSSLENGFSGRTIDTKFITPTLKKLSLPSMAESGWLTRSLEQPYPYNLDYNGKISDKKAREAFLKLIDYTEKNILSAENALRYLFFKVSKILENSHIKIIPIDTINHITIEQVYYFLEEQFFYKYNVYGGSKLPVIAFHALYELICLELKRYENCILAPLGNHNASDKTSKTSGDIEIFKNDSLFETLEIKLDKKIDYHMIKIAQEKIYSYSPERYYILSAVGIDDYSKCIGLISEIKEQHGCQVIINGLLPTLKYYLRLISSLEEFLKLYLKKINNDDFLQKIHKEICNRLIEKNFINHNL